MLQMDWTAMVMTGEKTGLYEKYIESSSQHVTKPGLRNEGSRRKKKKLSKKEMAEAIAKEKQMIAGLKGFFSGLKKQ